MCTRNQAFEILKIVYHACDPILGHSIHDAILYGSYARGDFTAESDIDQILPPVSRFGGGNRTEKKKTIIQRLAQFFEKYFGI